MVLVSRVAATSWLPVLAPVMYPGGRALMHICCHCMELLCVPVLSDICIVLRATAHAHVTHGHQIAAHTAMRVHHMQQRGNHHHVNS